MVRPFAQRGFPRLFLQEARRVARHESRGLTAPDMDWVPLLANDSENDDGPIGLEFMRSLERAFTATDIEKMTDELRQGRTRQKDLAGAIGISERTFRYRIREARALRYD